MKSKEELNALKEEVETVSRKLHELTEEELHLVIGGFGGMFQDSTQQWRVYCSECGETIYIGTKCAWPALGYCKHCQKNVILWKEQYND